MDEPILTAMVSVYDASRWLDGRIRNLMETDLYLAGGLQIYCVNANSPDSNDHDICTHFEGIKNYKYERIPACTVYGAWNWMIKNSSTPYLTNANSDDLVAPNCYDVLLNANADIAYCGWHTIGNEVTSWREVSGDGNQVTSYDPDRDLISCGHFPVWKRHLHDVVGLFDPSFKALGDADFWFRCWISGIRSFSPIQYMLAAYRWRDGENLWNRTADEDRTAEWHKMYSRQPGKLEFADVI